MSEERYPVLHDEGPYSCGNTAFYFTRRIYKGQIITASSVVHTDGRPYRTNDHIICDTCHRIIIAGHIRIADDGTYHCK